MDRQDSYNNNVSIRDGARFILDLDQASQEIPCFSRLAALSTPPGIMNVIDILHGCQLFSEVHAGGFRRLATMARLCQFRKGQVIFRENEPCPGVLVVGQGLVRVFKTGGGGKEHVLHIMGPGDSFAEVAAIGDFPLPASAEALKKTVCALLPQRPFRQALAEDHELCLDMMTGIALWARRLVALLEDIALRDAAGRVARFLLELSKSKSAADSSIKLPGLKRHVASHLNLTSETFSRTLRRFIDAGLIAEIDAGRLRLLHPKKLRQVAEGLFPEL
jgi:CRP/FNR family transcriptional regulator, dissimilatory nitrate respiration regulator